MHELVTEHELSASVAADMIQWTDEMNCHKCLNKYLDYIFINVNNMLANMFVMCDTLSAELLHISIGGYNQYWCWKQLLIVLRRALLHLCWEVSPSLTGASRAQRAYPSPSVSRPLLASVAITTGQSFVPSYGRSPRRS